MNVKDYCRQWNKKFVSQKEQDKLIKRKQKQDELAESKEYIPTPEEIAIACLEIQKGWTDEERELRARGRLPDFELIQNLC